LALRRGTGLVLALIGLAVVVSAAGLVFSALLVGGGPTVRQGSTLVLRLGDLAEVEPLGLFSSWLPSRPTVRATIDAIRRAKTDSRIKGLLVVPAGGATLWGKVQEVRDAVLDFRTSGKPAVAFLEFGGEQEYYVATACDRIFLLPTSPLDVRGLATYEVFFRGTLDKIGTYPDLVHIGDYKTAINTFTETGFTPAHREMAESLNGDLFSQLVDGIAARRSKSSDEVRALVDEGPFLPEDALRAGLIDDLAYRDEASRAARLAIDGDRAISLDDYARTGTTSGFGRADRIAIIYIVGMITSGRSGRATEGEFSGSDTISEYVRRAREDARVKAIVVRIDSPGGSSVASDVIWHELTLARAKKPVVVSMSDLAASGGYYVALPAHVIVAQPATLTGSIGIYAGKFVTGGTFEKLGARVDGVSAGRMADMNSPARPYSDAERAKLVEQLQAFYDGFVEKVAQARRSTPEQIDAIAQGRVWTGRQARDLGLVDELGGLERAIAIARERAKIPSTAKVEIVVYPPKRSWYELVAAPFSSVRTAIVSQILPRPEERAVARSLTSTLHLFRRGEPLALMPNVFVR